MAANIHTTSANAVTLMWGLLRLAPINAAARACFSVHSGIRSLLPLKWQYSFITTLEMAIFHSACGLVEYCIPWVVVNLDIQHSSVQYLLTVCH